MGNINDPIQDNYSETVRCNILKHLLASAICFMIQNFTEMVLI